ncbi:5-methylcytosine-specific restriction endonuclease McrA [Anoxybacillus calidus]|uniref:5-methylcytosine-specific restriction endonuclease McrA n=1 Tax=[Anoxybacillus] calidus TaxID=575178 RepID=A0A7V9YX36_9BACL|nr:HNH endonuclease signature motif containing protein [Anoxybacillus calidus]MBA2869985.1 5-methylcytosine-specific restriction endonuclease McrA [Anoxybacillus calidus]
MSQEKETRICRICGQQKEIHLFEVDKRVPHTYTNRCKACKAEISANYRKTLDGRALTAYHHGLQRCKKLGIPNEVTLDEVKRIFRAFDGLCIYCGAQETDEPFHLEHVIPLGKGGRHHASNLVISCPSCNRAKHDKPIVTFYYEHEPFTDEHFALVVHYLAFSNNTTKSEMLEQLVEQHADYLLEEMRKENERDNKRFERQLEKAAKKAVSANA